MYEVALLLLSPKQVRESAILLLLLASSDMTFIWNFVNIDHVIQKLKGRHTYREGGDSISLFFPLIKEVG